MEVKKKLGRWSPFQGNVFYSQNFNLWGPLYLTPHPLLGLKINVRQILNLSCTVLLLQVKVIHERKAID